ncbi:MAG TPA: toll/interleukin-1 receptor domain-containing protein, partial [Pyrinomonadaceae bacterium]|nr:toll/interleukin-1 receptor domain-containing protein [Pyrinomonadaceae bacterium]
MSPQRPADVYLSYNRVDEGMVERLVNLLELRGINIWRYRGVRPGEPMSKARDEALRALRQSKGALVILGMDGLGPYQEEEVFKGLARRVEESEGAYWVIPVLLPGADIRKLPVFLSHIQWVQFNKDLREPALENLVGSIKELLSPPIISDPSGDSRQDLSPNPASKDTESTAQKVTSNAPPSADPPPSDASFVKTLGELLESTALGKRLRPDEAKALQLAGGYSVSREQPVDSALMLGAILDRVKGKDSLRTERAFVSLLEKELAVNNAYGPIQGKEPSLPARQLVDGLPVALLRLPEAYGQYLSRITSPEEASRLALLRDELADVLSLAGDIAAKTHPKGEGIHTRHVIGAILATDVSPPPRPALAPIMPSPGYQPSAARQLQALGFDLNRLRTGFLTYLRKQQRGDELDEWSVILRQRPESSVSEVPAVAGKEGRASDKVASDPITKAPAHSFDPDPPVELPDGTKTDWTGGAAYDDELRRASEKENPQGASSPPNAPSSGFWP